MVSLWKKNESSLYKSTELGHLQGKKRKKGHLSAILEMHEVDLGLHCEGRHCV